MTSWKSSFALVEKVEKEFGPIDILVNNAGVTKWQPFVEIAEADWDRVLDINLKGQFLAARAVVPGMIKRGRGRIINLGSVTSKKGYANAIPYCTSKFGVMGFTQGLAMELAPYDITVNTVCPGIVMTPLHDGLVEEMAAQRGVSFTQAKDDFVGWIPSETSTGAPGRRQHGRLPRVGLWAESDRRHLSRRWRDGYGLNHSSVTCARFCRALTP